MAALPVLRALDDWPVPTVAAAVIGPSGVLASHGDTARQFALASVTKPLVARAVQIAIEEGRVECPTCKSLGWHQYSDEEGGLYYSECQTCRNPLRRSQPSA